MIQGTLERCSRVYDTTERELNGAVAVVRFWIASKRSTFAVAVVSNGAGGGIIDGSDDIGIRLRTDRFCKR